MNQKNKNVEERKEQYNDNKISDGVENRNNTDNIYFENEFTDEDCFLKFVIGKQTEDSNSRDTSDLRTYIKVYKGFDEDEIIHFDSANTDKWIAIKQTRYMQDLLDYFGYVLKNEVGFYQEKHNNSVEDNITFLIDEFGYEDSVISYTKHLINN